MHGGHHTGDYRRRDGRQIEVARDIQGLRRARHTGANADVISRPINVKIKKSAGVIVNPKIARHRPEGVDPGAVNQHLKIAVEVGGVDIKNRIGATEIQQAVGGGGANAQHSRKTIIPTRTLGGIEGPWCYIASGNTSQKIVVCFNCTGSD